MNSNSASVAKVRNALNEISEAGDLKKSRNQLNDLQRHLVLLAREQKLFLSLAADVAALIQSEGEWQKHAPKKSSLTDSGFLKSFNVLKQEILAALQRL